MEFKAKIPGTKKSKYEPVPVLILLPKPQPKATIYKIGATIRLKMNFIMRCFNTTQSRQKTVQISYSIISSPSFLSILRRHLLNWNDV